MTQRNVRRGIALALLAGMLCMSPVGAADLESGAKYCFSTEDFQTLGPDELTGACITGVPGRGQGTLLLGSRQIRPGDILTRSQLDALTYQSPQGEADAKVTFCPIYGRRVEPESELTFSIRKKENLPPTAMDGSLETYKNLENEGTLRAEDPEGGALTYNLVVPPKRGTVELREDGSFLYTPRKNKVGKDLFTFTVTDDHGQVSNEATVTVEILKPTDSAAYRDMTTGQFEALWLKNTGLFAGTQVAGEPCFGPEEPVTRGDFLAMTMKLLGIPVDETLTQSGFRDQELAPEHLRPYLAAAMRLGLTQGYSKETGVEFRPGDAITQEEAASMVQTMLRLPVPGDVETAAWSDEAMAALRQAGLELTEPKAALTRAGAAELLYEVSKLMEDAPGLEVFKRN